MKEEEAHRGKLKVENPERRGENNLLGKCTALREDRRIDLCQTASRNRTVEKFRRSHLGEL